MHIPAGFCSATVCVAAAGLSAGALLASRLIGREASPRVSPAGIAALAAAVCAAQMLDVPVAGGASAHLLGGALLGILAGPAAGLMAMTCVLAVQALLFGDGGIAALGVNLLSMGVAGVVGGWAVHRALAGGVIAAGVAGVVAGLASVAVCAGALALSGTAGFAAVCAVMLEGQLPVALAEGVVTAVAFAVLRQAPSVRWPAAAAVALCCAVPCASALPDGLESAAVQLGFADRAVVQVALLAGLEPLLAACIGVAAVATAVWLIVRARPV